MLQAGIVGLPNVGKSTLFNAVTRSRKAAAENYPFCTIDPNIGVVVVPDERLEKLGRAGGETSLRLTYDCVLGRYTLSVWAVSADLEPARKRSLIDGAVRNMADAAPADADGKAPPEKKPAEVKPPDGKTEAPLDDFDLNKSDLGL